MRHNRRYPRGAASPVRRMGGFLLVTFTTLACTAPPDAGAQETRTHTLPIGLTFDYPVHWEATDAEAMGFVLIPADAGFLPDGGRSDFFIISAAGAPAGVSRPGDPRLLDFFTRDIPQMQQIGRSGAVDTPIGPGAIVTYGADLGGQGLYQRVYIALDGGQGFYMLHMTGDPTLLDRRAGAARSIFGSFRRAASEVDGAVVGQWTRRTSEYSSGYGDVPGLAFSSTATIVFRPDGSAFRSEDARFDSDYLGGESGGDVVRGRVGTSGNSMIITWEDGTVDIFEYAVFMHEGAPVLKLVAAEEEPLYYRRAP